MREPILSGSGPDLEKLMVRYQQADAHATTALIAAVTPALLRFFASQMGDRPRLKICFRRRGSGYTRQAHVPSGRTGVAVALKAQFRAMGKGRKSEDLAFALLSRT
jgi:hypothetical protein